MWLGKCRCREKASVINKKKSKTLFFGNEKKTKKYISDLWCARPIYILTRFLQSRRGLTPDFTEIFNLFIKIHDLQFL